MNSNSIALQVGHNARREALSIAAHAVAQHLNRDHSDHGASELPCSCGFTARYAGRHPKTFTTALGPMCLDRAYYHCGVCKQGFYPRDSRLGMEGSMLSPAVTRMTGLVGAMVSFEEGNELLSELAGVAVNTKQVERQAEALGREIAKDECGHVEAVTDAEIAPTLYLGMDGTGIPIRKEELVGRKGKQADGSAKTREVKLCTVWSAEGRDEEGVPVRDEGSVTDLESRSRRSRECCLHGKNTNLERVSNVIRLFGSESTKNRPNSMIAAN